jgi:taurine dioxygenase
MYGHLIPHQNKAADTAVTDKEGPKDLRVTPLDASFGVQVEGLRCSPPPSEAKLSNLRKLVYQYGLVVIRQGNYLTQKEQVAFSRALDPHNKGLYFQHAHHSLAKDPHIYRVSNDEGHGVKTFGGTFHHDGLFEEEIFCMNVFCMVQIPQHGFASHYADARQIARRMTAQHPETIKRLSQLKSVYIPSGVQHFNAFTHPTTGDKLVMPCGYGMVEPLEGGGVKKVSKEEKDKLQKLYTELVGAADVQYRHEWQPGDVVVLDNMAVLHRAPTREEHLAITNDVRVLHRCCILGVPELPF